MLEGVTREAVLAHPAVREFFTSRPIAPSTFKQYRGALTCLFQGIHEVFGEAPGAVDFQHFWKLHDDRGHPLGTEPMQPQDVRRLVQWYWENEPNPKRYSRHLQAWRQFFRFLYTNRMILDDCAAFIPSARVDRGPSRFRALSEEQCRALLAAAANSGECSVPCFTLIHVWLNTGWRPGALVQFKWGDIDWERKLLCPEGRKTGLEVAPLVKGVEVSLRIYHQWYIRRAGEPGPEDLVFHAPGFSMRSSDDLRHLLRSLASRAGLPADITGRWLRKTVATGMYRAGIPTPLITQLLGHKNPTTTDAYISEQIEIDRKIKESIPEFHHLVGLLQPRPGP